MLHRRPEGTVGRGAGGGRCLVCYLCKVSGWWIRKKHVEGVDGDICVLLLCFYLCSILTALTSESARLTTNFFISCYLTCGMIAWKSKQCPTRNICSCVCVSYIFLYHLLATRIAFPLLFICFQSSGSWNEDSRVLPNTHAHTRTDTLTHKHTHTHTPAPTNTHACARKHINTLTHAHTTAFFLYLCVTYVCPAFVLRGRHLGPVPAGSDTTEACTTAACCSSYRAQPRSASCLHCGVPELDP